jgi:TonB-linked SusC/RagA family outer membrane protein
VYGVALLMQQTRIQGSGNAVYNFIPNNVRGVIGRVGYDYKQKYIVEFNGAYNGSDRFAKENRYGFFPSGSVAWNISEESFFKDNIQFIDRLKLRGSYGLLGNDKIGNNFSYYYQPEYTTAGGVVFFGNPNPNSGTAIREGRLGNPNVSWEKEKKLNVGAEMGFLNNKLSATFDYFNNDRYDIMTDRGSANASVTSAFGQSLPAVNLGKVNNQGYEVELSYSNTINKELSFNVRGTYSHTKNKILYQDEPAYKYAYQSFTGQSIGMQRVYTFIGFYKDSADVANSPLRSGARPGDLKYADLNKDNVIDGFDMAVQGKPTFPNTTAGLQLGVRFKGFNAGVFFQGAKDFYVRGGAEAIQAFSSNSLEIHKQAWTPALGDNAKYPLLTFIPGSSDARSNPSTFWFMPGDYIRLKTAEIGYSLPQSIMSHLKMKSIKIYANGLNLFTWTKLSKLYQLDPEITAGTDRVNYPPQRIFNFGISANF